MKKQYLKSICGIEEETINQHVDYINPLSLICSEEFNLSTKKDYISNYRERAINRVIYLQIPFTSESNTIYELIRKFIKVYNPINGNEMIMNGGSGNSISTSIEFVDKDTKDKIYLHLDHDAISFDPYKFNRYNPENPIPERDR